MLIYVGEDDHELFVNNAFQNQCVSEDNGPESTRPFTNHETTQSTTTSTSENGHNQTDSALSTNATAKTPNSQSINSRDRGIIIGKFNFLFMFMYLIPAIYFLLIMAFTCMSIVHFKINN